MDNNIFFKYKNDIAPTSGSILVSEPHLPDLNFDRTVILLCKHDDQGSFGFVLNRKSKVKIGELLPEMEGLDIPVYIGGPVEQNTLHFIHRDDTLPEAEEITRELFWGGEFALLLSWLHDNVISPDDVRFFLGYSGWAAGQLQDEIEENSWMVFEPMAGELLFNTRPEDMWKAILEKMGGRFSLYAKYPSDPRLN